MLHFRGTEICMLEILSTDPFSQSSRAAPPERIKSQPVCIPCTTDSSLANLFPGRSRTANSKMGSFAAHGCQRGRTGRRLWRCVLLLLGSRNRTNTCTQTIYEAVREKELRPY